MTGGIVFGVMLIVPSLFAASESDPTETAIVPATPIAPIGSTMGVAAREGRVGMSISLPGAFRVETVGDPSSASPNKIIGPAISRVEDLPRPIAESRDSSDSNIFLAAADSTPQPDQALVTLDAITVIGKREDSADERRLASPTPLIEMPQEQVQRLGMIFAGQAMRGFPMLGVSGPPGYATDVRFRGLRMGYTAVLVDGETVLGGGRERQLRVDRIPTTLIDRINVMPVAPADLAQEGIGGTVDIRLREIPDQARTSAIVNGGQVHGNGVGGGAFATGDTAGDWGWLLAGNATRTGRWSPQDQETSDSAGTKTGLQRRIDEVRADEYNLTPRFRWSHGGVTIRLDPLFLDKKEFITNDIDNLSGAGALQNHQGVAIDREHTVARGTGSMTVSVGPERDLTVGGIWQRSREEKNTNTAVLNATGTQTGRTLDKVTDQEWRRKGFVRIDDTGTAGHKIAAGVEMGEWGRLDTAGTTNLLTGATSSPNPGGSRNNLAERFGAAFVFDQVSISDRQVLTPGLRAEWRDLTVRDDQGAEVSARRSEPLPSLHWLWRTTNSTSLRASVAREIRWATFNDLSTVVERSSANSLDTPDITGDPNLKPERATAVELGVEHRAEGNYFVAANGFYRRIQDVVERQTAQEGSRWVQRPVNSGGADFAGATLDGRVHLARIGMPGLWLYGNYTRLWSRTKDVNTGKIRKLREMPDALANAGFDYRNGPSGLMLGANYSYNSGYNNLEPQEFNSRNAYGHEGSTGFIDAYVAKRLASHWLVRLTGHNLTATEKFKATTIYNSDGRVNQSQARREYSLRTAILSLEAEF